MDEVTDSISMAGKGKIWAQPELGQYRERGDEKKRRRGGYVLKNGWGGSIKATNKKTLPLMRNIRAREKREGGVPNTTDIANHPKAASCVWGVR